MIPSSLRTHKVWDLVSLPLVKSEPLKVWFDSALVGMMVAVVIVGAVLL